MLDNSKSLLAGAIALLSSLGLHQINLTSVADFLQALAGACLAFAAIRGGMKKAPTQEPQKTEPQATGKSRGFIGVKGGEK